MKQKPYLTKADVDVLLQAANDFADKNQFAVSIAVVDDGGHLLGFTRRDDCPAVSASIAQEKARSSALGRKESKAYEDMINGGRIAYLSVPVLQGMLEGGVNIVYEGHTIGAIGVSGVKSNQDAEVAKAGIAAWQAQH
jgi:glc operon protein GlcG